MITFHLLFSMIFAVGVFTVNAEEAVNNKPFILDMVHHNPGEERTDSKYLNPVVLKEWGYNGQVVNDYLQAAINYHSFDKTLFQPGSEAERWRSECENRIRKQIDAAEKAGIDIYYFTDFMVLPREILEKYKRKICSSNGDINIHKPLTQKLLRISLQEIFTLFPEVDGLIVRTGEVYSHNVPFHLGNNPIIRGVKSHQVILNIMRDEIAVKLDKKLIYRTWDFGTLHTNPKNYLKLCKLITPHPNLIFSIKHTNGDFHRTELFNTTIGLGNHPQMIEVQCQREYEGKGAHPNYISEGVINGFEELDNLQEPGSLKSLNEFKDNPLYAGIWTWTRGGGWQGPYIQNEFWCDLNSWTMANWAGNSQLDEAEIFSQFAKKFGFEGSDEKILREIALLSADGVIRGRASTKGKINVWWTRDHYIGVPPNMTKQALLEKQEAVVIWKKIEQLSKQLTIADKQLLDFIQVSCSYGRIKYEIFDASWQITDLKRKGQSSSLEMKALIDRYDQLWIEYNKLYQDYPSCPTLYKDEAMGYEHNIGAFGKPGIGALVEQLRSIQ